MSSEFGKRLKLARERAGLTQPQLASLVPMAQSTLASAESGGDGSRLTARLAHHCGVDAYWLATGEGSMLGPLHEPAGRYQAPAEPDLAAALRVVLRALVGISPMRWAAVRSQLDHITANPASLDDAARELAHQLSLPSP